LIQPKGVSLADVSREILNDFSPTEQRRLNSDITVDSLVLPADAKVSCKYGDCCTSPSRRDQTKSKAWLCGSNYSHMDRVGGCVGYCRFERFLSDGVSARDRRP
jgi:hypothetical protein